ncbi:family 78 glycoside hydrolase catalytic domain [Micromonospora sp. NPDC049101]|uniref:family 78 glycoside hydrolase catalytic domain n=1 Tax=Micromonospora sp. NPDC049101 TaxID=3155032 RepID=UPI0033F40F52
MSLQVDDLRTDARTNPLGIDNPTPEFAWRLVADRPGTLQTAYEIEISTSDGAWWNSGRIRGDRPFGVAYAGPPLESCRRYHWRVRVVDDAGTISGWSGPAWFETALLDPAGWRAHWISGPPESAQDHAALYLRTTVEVSDRIVRGRAYVSALGWYRFFVNGHDVTGDALVPRWTPLDHMVEYQTYDVTGFFRPGTNVVAMAVGDGRFRGRLGALDKRSVYGDRLAGLVQVDLELADGGVARLDSDERWCAGPGRILASDPKWGERVDLRIDDHAWRTAATTPVTPPPVTLHPVDVLPWPDRQLVAEEVERVRCIERLPATRVWRSPGGRQLVDFGRNVSGVARLLLAGPAGTTVSVTYSELLDPAGELDAAHTANHGRAKPQRDQVTLDGGPTWYQPWFTVRGFRYVEIDGPAEDLTGAEAIVLSTDVAATGRVDTSDERLNRFHDNVLASVRANFADTPTDCPTRERSGYTGDIQTFAPTAVVCVDAQAFLRRYLRNLACEQLPDGRVPPMIPSEDSTFSGGRRTFSKLASGSVGWGDASVILPWTLYRYHGDERVLDRQYDSMRRWVDHLERRARTRSGWARWFGKRVGGQERYILDSGFHFGEWYRAGSDTGSQVRNLLVRRPVVATAYLARSAHLLSRAAGVLGRDADAATYADLAHAVRAAWRAAFVRPDGRIGADGQDDYVRALGFDLLTGEQRPAAIARLAALVEGAGTRVTTGLLSTPMILPVLADGGRADLAYALLMRTASPSWLAQVERGATTVWETWDGYDDKGRGLLSHNHYTHGVVAGFLTEYVAGLTPAEPGYRVIDVRPVPGGGLTHASATVRTPYGPASSAWRVDGGTCTLTVTVPAGTSARIHTDRTVDVGSGIHEISWGQIAVR